MEASIAQTSSKHSTPYVLYLMIIILFVKLSHISHHKPVSPRFKLRNHKFKSQNTSINMQLERDHPVIGCLKMGAKVELVCT